MKKIKQIPFIILGVIVLTFVYVRNSQDIYTTSYGALSENYFDVFSTNASNLAFLVDTSGCKVPNIDPFDKSIKHLLPTVRKLKCSVSHDLIYQVGNYLNLNWTAINASELKDEIKYCKYQSIFRLPDEKQDHNDFEYGNDSAGFNSEIKINDEFVRVQCFNKSGDVKYTNFFSFIHLKDKVEKRCDNKYKRNRHKRKEQLNVLMIGVDSISRNNQLRYMNKTWSYLVKNMSAIDLLAYNKVADNTFVNIVPMTAGKYVEELPWNETIRWTPMDEYNFIWNDYSENGYRTFYAEDHPEIAIFDFGKSGFEIPPTDYFNRPYFLAIEKHEEVWNSDHYCIHGRTETDMVLEYLKNFAELFKSKPYFAFSFITRLTHAYMEETYKADDLYLKFLTELNQSGNLKNTVLFFFSDHGLRYGDVRETYVGKLEERLPFMQIVFPKWFLNKYPEIHKNLRTNSRRLTSPFDIYATLKHILNFDGSRTSKPKAKRSISLLDEIPEERSCEDADILPHWCTCSRHEKLDIKNETVIKISKIMVEKINKELEDSLDVCEKLSLNSIRYAIRVIPSDKVLRFQKSKNDVVDRHVVYGERANSYIDYQITLQTSPGNAVFEGTIRYDENEKTYDMVGDISRINKYGKQSHCVDRHHLKKLCYCKKQI